MIATRTPPVQRHTIAAALALFMAFACPSAAIAADPAPSKGEEPHTLSPLECLYAATDAHGVKRPRLLLSILLQERGTIGRVNWNTNKTYDIGPMQVNSCWLPKLAAHWRAPVSAVFTAIRDNWCSNVEAAALILGLAIDEAAGNVWEGVARYHSPNPSLGHPYMAKVAHTYAQLSHSRP